MGWAHSRTVPPPGGVLESHCAGSAFDHGIRGRSLRHCLPSCDKESTYQTEYISKGWMCHYLGKHPLPLRSRRLDGCTKSGRQIHPLCLPGVVLVPHERGNLWLLASGSGEIALGIYLSLCSAIRIGVGPQDGEAIANHSRRNIDQPFAAHWELYEGVHIDDIVRSQ